MEILDYNQLILVMMRISSGMSEDLQKIFDDSKCSRLLKKVLRDERSFDIRIQQFQTYLEKSSSNKLISYF